MADLPSCCQLGARKTNDFVHCGKHTLQLSAFLQNTMRDESESTMKMKNSYNLNSKP